MRTSEREGGARAWVRVVRAGLGEGGRRKEHGREKKEERREKREKRREGGKGKGKRWKGAIAKRKIKRRVATKRQGVGKEEARGNPRV